MESLHQTTESTELVPIATQAQEQAEVLDSELERMIEVLRQEGQSQRRRIKVMTRLFGWIGGSIALWSAGVVAYAWLTGRWDSLHYLTLLGFSGFLGFLSFLALASKKHKEAARVVSRCSDPRALGPLIDSLNIQDMKIQARVTEAVTRLLSNLDAEAAAQLSSDQVDTLNSRLNHAGRFFGFRSSASNHQVGILFGRTTRTSDGWFTMGSIASAGKVRWPPLDLKGLQERADALLLATINASPLFGNTETFRYVERIARTRPTEEGGRGLKSAAEAALPALQARVEMLRTGEQLLRPADPLAGELLLRPATGAATTEESQLLRPSNSG